MKHACLLLETKRNIASILQIIFSAAPLYTYYKETGDFFTTFSVHKENKLYTPNAYNNN